MTCQPPKNASDARRATIASSHGLSVIDHLSPKVILFRVRIDTKLRTSKAISDCGIPGNVRRCLQFE
jgi:hypothetical protein